MSISFMRIKILISCLIVNIVLQINSLLQLKPNLSLILESIRRRQLSDRFKYFDYFFIMLSKHCLQCVKFSGKFHMR